MMGSMELVQPIRAVSEADSPALRLFSLLEVIAGKERLTSLPALAEETGLPKATLHRIWL